MPYLTYAEYQSFGFGSIEESEFKRLLPKASDVVDSATRDFYQFHELETDILYRRNKFKKAVACQVEYFHDMDATSTHALNEPAYVTIGRTSISNGFRNSQDAQQAQSGIVGPDVYMYLVGTGLLYRGIGVV